MVDPSAYHPEQRLMPRFTITQDEIDQLIALFEWTSQTEPVADVWPPNTIQVAGSAGLNINAVENLGSVNNSDPIITQGQTIYSQRCASCHAITEGVVLVGPSFWNIANHAAMRVDGQSAEDYLRDSILYPSEYIVEGFQDVMQKNFAEVLSSQDISALIAYLMTFDSEVTQ
jgi:cytochrome c2